MNVKNNKRHKETIEKIETVFMEYLKTKDISQIKVTDICERAQINRSTFYVNFTDIYELAGKIRAKLKDEVDEMLRNTTDWNYTEKDFFKLFLHIKVNQELYKCYFKLGYDSNEDFMLHDISKPSEINEQNMDYHILFFKSGFNAIVKKWLEGGCAESPKQMTDILLAEYKGRYKFS